MSESIKYARPYAKAAFQLARDNADLAGWSEMLRLASQIAVNEQVAEAVANPNVSKRQAAELFTTVAADRFDEQFANLLKLLADNGRLLILPDISGMFEQLRQELEKRLSVQVVSAVVLSEGQQSRIQAALSKRFDRTINLETATDASILGGAIIYAGDMVIDGSVLGRLNKLATRLAE